MTENKGFDEWYNDHNPVVKYLIRPALRAVNASENPRLGGLAAGAAATLGDVAALELILRGVEFVTGYDMGDTTLKVMSNPALFGCAYLAANRMITNLATGFKKYQMQIQSK